MTGRLALLAATTGLGACAVAPTQDILDGITAECGAPRDMLTLRGGDRVVFKPSPDVSSLKVDCIVAGLQAANIKPPGFLGKEVGK